MASVTLKNLVKRFGKVTAIDDVSLEIRDGEFIILLGPSGCGKSTLLYSIAGLEEISSGEIYIGERLMNRVPPKARNIAMVFQDYALYPHMNVYNNMAFGLKLRKASAAEIERRVTEAATLLSIEHLLQRRPRELSGGQRQRVALGRAIVREPSVFLMDEPLSNLDALLRVQMRTEISKLHHRLQTTFIYVTHDQVEAMTMGDRIVILKDGVIQQVGTPQEVYNNPRNLFVAGFIGTPAMTMLAGHLVAHDGTLAFDAGTFKVPLPATRAAALAAYLDRPVLAGIRPSGVGVVHATAPAGSSTVAGRIEAVEPMGETAYVIASIGGQTVTARVDPTAMPAVGQTIQLSIDGAALYLFDTHTQQALTGNAAPTPAMASARP